MITEQVQARRAEANERSVAYARFYAPLAVVSVVISFLPILPEEYGTLWEMAGREAGDPAMIGILLMVAMIGLLGYASFRPVTRPVVPAVIAVLAALIVVMLLTKPGTGTPTPELTPFGDAALAIALCVVALAVSHVVQLGRS